MRFGAAAGVGPFTWLGLRLASYGGVNGQTLLVLMNQSLHTNAGVGARKDVDGGDKSRILFTRDPFPVSVSVNILYHSTEYRVHTGTSSTR